MEVQQLLLDLGPEGILELVAVVHVRALEGEGSHGTDEGAGTAIHALVAVKIQLFFPFPCLAPPEGEGLNNWVGWEDLSWSGSAPMCVDKPENCFGPYMLDTGHENSVAHAGAKSAQATRAQPHWYAAVREAPGLAGDRDKVIRLSGYQYEIFFKQVPFPPDDWEFNDHDQVHGWITLMNEDETEFFGLGVYAHKWSPPPMLDRWTYMSWGTTLDGWNVTTVHRAEAEWRHLEIVVKPYTGSVGDVEFYIDSVLVGQGRRQPGEDCRGVAVTRIGMGANPTHIAEDYIANSYETYQYDEIQVTVESAPLPCANPDLRFDADGDGDVDQDDFAVLQACYTGASGTYACPTCRCLNADTDSDIDSDDLEAFEQCASGPDVPAEVTCDDALPPP